MTTKSQTPINLRAASDFEAKTLLMRARLLVEKRAAPTPSYMDRVIDWPSGNLEARVLVGGIQVPDIEDGSNDAEVLDDFLMEKSKGGLGVWGLGAESEGVFIGGAPFNVLRNWIKGELIMSPIIAISLDQDIVLIAEEQLRFLVIGAPRECMRTLDARFGGKAALCERLKDQIEDGEVGFGEEDRKWAIGTLLNWACG